MSMDTDRDNFSLLVEACLVQVLASNEWLESRILALSVDQLAVDSVVRVLVDRGMPGALESHAWVLSSEA